MGIPYTEPAYAPLMRTYKVFRHLGLRHMVITDASSSSECEAVGMITRRQLDHVCVQAQEPVHKCWLLSQHCIFLFFFFFFCCRYV